MPSITWAVRKPWSSLAPLMALALGGLAGCGESTTFGTVTGRVLLRGKPVSAGQVSFLGEDGVPVCGAIGPDSTYRVEQVPIGVAIVTVDDAPQGEPPKPAAPRVVGRRTDGRPILAPAPGSTPKPRPPSAMPAKYTDTKTSGLQLTVGRGRNQFDIEMK